MPLIGDNDSGRVFPVAPRPDREVGSLLAVGCMVCGDSELARLEAGPELPLLLGGAALDAYDRMPRPSAQPAASLPVGGLFVLGDGRQRMIIRCGPLGSRPVGTHWQMDQLSFTFSVGGREILTDPGTFCYTPWPEWKRWFEDSRAHNTAEVDGEAHCRRYLSPQRHRVLIPEADPKLEHFEVRDDRILFAGSHHGYRRLKGGGAHRREVVHRPGSSTWQIIDQFELLGSHSIAWYFHLAENMTARQTSRGWILTDNDVSILLRCVKWCPADARIEEGWVAPGYGIKCAAPVLVFNDRTEEPSTRRWELEILNNKASS